MSGYASDDFMVEDYDDEAFDYSEDEHQSDVEIPAAADARASQLVRESQAVSQFDSLGYNTFDDNDLVDDVGDFEPVLDAAHTKKPWEVDFWVYNPEELRRKQSEIVARIEPLLSISKEATRLLLRQYFWKEEKLIEDYLSDPNRTLEKAGITAFPPVPQLKAGDDGFTCTICFCSGADESYLEMTCGHRFCSDCYRTYVTGKVLEGESWRIHCPAPGCKYLLGIEALRLLLSSDAAALERYEENLTRSFVNDLETFTWCPAPNCEYAVECHVPRTAWETTIPAVQCKCGNPFCFGCKLENHLPAPCAMVVRWLQKCKDDSETSKWIKVNTKECVKCKSTIEKNGGCNHMTCRECHYEFCWICMGPWKEHGQQFYNCSRFNEDSSKEARESASKTRLSLERYIHYYTRFNNHEQSAKLARKLLATTEKNMEQMQRELALSWIEVQFLRDAVDVLSMCRSTLKWTYVLAYYMVADNQKIIFEDNQSDLEMATELLNGLVEDPIGIDSPDNIKRKIMDKCTYVKARWETLLCDITAGLQENRWQFETL
ncbi:hypothetical protein H4217_003043 [Coemansia sp. RSA 1939]|nr:hypothetical protein H4217_003043 [Coemansia sp. RSA 1939]